MKQGSSIDSQSAGIEGRAGPPRSAWAWIPSLYFSQGIPYVIVMTLSVVMYKRLGISNTDIALYTSWLYLPWVIKPLWSPAVDITRTKRFWIISMQFVVSIALASVAFTIPGSGFFKGSLFLFWIMAFASSTHDIAADGFYMLSLSKHEQAWWVGIRSTFYRISMIVGTGLLVVLAGTLESKNGLSPVSVEVSAAPGVGDATIVDPTEVRFEAVEGPMQVIVHPRALQVCITNRAPEEAQRLVSRAKTWNNSQGFNQETVVTEPAQSRTWWTENISRRLGEAWRRWFVSPIQRLLTSVFPKEERAPAALTAGNLGAVYVSLSRPPEPGIKVVVTLDREKAGLEYVGLAKGDKGFRVIQGERFVFTESNWDKAAMAVIQLDPKLKEAAHTRYIITSGNIPLAWSITLIVVAVLFLLFSCWHALILPRPANDRPVASHDGFVAGFLSTLGSFFKKPGAGMALAFILLYRFSEAQLLKIISPFLLDGREAGGLGLTTSQVGVAYGTFGVLALTLGGLLGGFLAAKHGLKKVLPLMIAAMYLPKPIFIAVAYTQPENFLSICLAVAGEQFGYGLGFTAYMLYMLHFADGEHKTAHYAICTGFMALGMMVPGMWSGWMVDLIGYSNFFVWVTLAAIPGFLLAANIKVDPAFGKRSD